MTGMYHIVYLVYTPFQLLGEQATAAAFVRVGEGEAPQVTCRSSTKKNSLDIVPFVIPREVWRVCV